MQSQADGRKAGGEATASKCQNGRLASSTPASGGGCGGTGRGSGGTSAYSGVGHGEECRRRRSPSLSRSEQAFVRSGRLFGGLLSDVRRRLAPRVYWSDLRDGFHPQSIASFVFLYVASLAPLITFGGILGDYTGGNMVCDKAIC